jgi:hypothetical protein
MKRIPLTQGKVALVDDEDYVWLSQWKWCAHLVGKKWYAVHNHYEGPIQHHWRMHRLIMKAGKGKQVDHINGDGLDNRKENLRFCTHTGNMRNAGPHCDGSSGYKGVYWHRKNSRWQAHITINGKQRYLGHFRVKEDAARCYNEAASKHYGEFAWLNPLPN